MPVQGGWPALLFVVALLGTACLRRYAQWRQLFDQPGERRSHSVATPRGGGMAIVAAVLLGCALAAWRQPAAAGLIGGFALGLAAVAAVGWWDDHRPLPASWRLLVHLLASAWLGWLVWRAGGHWWDALFAAAACVVLVNVWNFMDGINGLATSQAVLAALAFGWVLPMPWALAAYGFAAACLGFLPFNFPRARIFMGDGGSGSLGYVLAALLALVVVKGGSDWWRGWWPLTAFLVDAGFTLLRRMLAGQRWWEPHAQHVYQAASRRLGSHVPVTLGYACFSLLAIVLFLGASRLGPGQAVVAALVWAVLGALTWLFLRKGLRYH